MAPKAKERQPAIIAVYPLAQVAARNVFDGRTCLIRLGDNGVVSVTEDGTTLIFPPGTCIYEVAV